MTRPRTVLGLYLLWPYLLWPYLLGLYLLRLYLLWLYLLWLYLLRLYSYFRWLLLGTALVSEYCARFGDDYFSYWVGGVKYVSINSQYYHILCVDNPEADEMAREQAAWVEEELSASATAGAVHVVVLSHITPFMGAEDEETGHFNWKRAPREWMVRLCSQPHLPGGRATIWLCGHYHASCMARTQAGTEVVTTGAAGGVINWSKPPQATATPRPATKPSIARLPRLPHWLPRACPLSAHHRLPASRTGARHAARLPVHGVRQHAARHLRRLQLGPASMPRPTRPDRPPLPRAQRCAAHLG